MSPDGTPEDAGYAGEMRRAHKPGGVEIPAAFEP
jgi:hypothetical protein